MCLTVMEMSNTVSPCPDSKITANACGNAQGLKIDLKLCHLKLAHYYILKHAFFKINKLIWMI